MVSTSFAVPLRAPVSAADVALLSCMYALLCDVILINVQINK